MYTKGYLLLDIRESQFFICPEMVFREYFFPISMPRAEETNILPRSTIDDSSYLGFDMHATIDEATIEETPLVCMESPSESLMRLINLFLLGTALRHVRHHSDIKILLLALLDAVFRFLLFHLRHLSMSYVAISRSSLSGVDKIVEPCNFVEAFKWIDGTK